MEQSKEQVYTEYLVLRCQQGEKEAWAELVGLWQRPLEKFTLRMTGVPSVVHDILQDSWIAVARQLNGLKEPMYFKRWIYRIVSNKCVDWIRKQERIRRLQKNYEDSMIATDSWQPAPRNECLDIVRTALARLSYEQRLLVTLFYIEEFSLGEISYALSIPTGTVKSRLHKVRSDLKTIIENEEKYNE
jgi:RNA polymerase sigma factor (sigma-70 family)